MLFLQKDGIMKLISSVEDLVEAENACLIKIHKKGE